MISLKSYDCNVGTMVKVSSKDIFHDTAKTAGASDEVAALAYLTIWGASVGASAYHGYKRNDSLGWGIGWGLLGGMFPVIVPAIAFAQGFGKRVY